MKQVARVISPVVIMSLTVGSTAAVAAPVAPATAVDGLVSTQDAMNADQARADRQHVAELLAREDVRQQLAAQGVDPAEVEQRVAALSDQEVHQMRAKLDQMPAGASSVIGVLFAVFVILLITDLLGLTKVFPFTR